MGNQTAFELLLMQYGALTGGLMLLASLKRQPDDLKLPYALFATVALLVAVRNHMRLTLGEAVSAPYEIVISTATNVALIEAVVLLIFQHIEQAKNVAGWMRRGAVYAAKGGTMTALAGSAAYLTIAKQADGGFSFVVSSAFSVLVIGRLAQKPLFAVVGLGCCLAVFSGLQKDAWVHSHLQDDLMRVAFWGSCAFMAFLGIKTKDDN